MPHILERYNGVDPYSMYFSVYNAPLGIPQDYIPMLTYASVEPFLLLLYNAP